MTTSEIHPGGMNMTSNHDEPRVWLGCLACYNGGHLVGERLDLATAATATPASIHTSPTDAARFAREAVTGPHEELWVMDAEYVPLSGEFGQLECAAISEAYDQLDADEWPAYIAYASLGVSADRLPCVEEFREAYNGEWNSREEFAQELADDLGFDPDNSWPGSYIDWERAARDLFMDYSDEPAPGGRIYVFRNM